MILLLSLLAASHAWTPRTGDIVLHASTSRQSQALQLATGSPYTHAGLVFVRDGEAVVVEAVEPVRVVPLKSWVERGVDARVLVLRLSDGSALDAQGQAALWSAASGMLGRHYDPWFGWDDQRIYCSELVWKAYDQALGLELVPLRGLGTWDLSHPQVQALVAERYPGGVPADEPAVAPSQLLESLLLEVVHLR